MGLKILGKMILKGQLKAFTSSGTTTTTTTTTAAPTTTTTTTTTTAAPTTTTTTTTTTAAPTTTTTTTTTTTAAPTTTTTTTTAAPTTTTTTTTTAAPSTMILSVNSTPRALVGGGVTYNPTFINADYRQYFTSVNNNLNNCILNGYLPLQNNLNSSYSYTRFDQSLPTFIFNFRIPTVITKYRMWNGFMANIGVSAVNFLAGYTDLGNQTPQAWSLQGSNDDVNWTTVDTRTSQAMLPYASASDPATSSYSEFEISSPTAYKSYRLILSGRGRTSIYCNKSGCFYDTQLGEVQLWGYESPTTSCALHGYNTLLPTAKYYTSAGVVTNTDPFSSAFNLGTILGISNTIAAWTAAKNNGGNFFVNTGSTKEGYIGFDYPITLTSYKLWNPAGSTITYSFRLYGANTFGTWTLLDTRTLATIGSASTFTIASPALYSYYRISIFGSSNTVSSKSGPNGFYGLIKDIQLQGYLT